MLGEIKKNIGYILLGKYASFWNECISKNLIQIGWDELGDLNYYKSQNEITEKLKQIYNVEYNPSNDSLAIWEFSKKINIGDVIIAKKGTNKIIGFGIVKSKYYYDNEKDEYRNIRNVEWIKTGEWDVKCLNLSSNLPIKTLTEMFYSKDIQIIKNILENDESNLLEEIYKEENQYTDRDFLKEVYINEDSYKELVNLILRKKNVILQGAPGVGKTFMAKRLAYSIIGYKDDTKIKFIQFHQSYSYEDFIEGWRPNKDGFKIEKGVFYEFCKEASNNPDCKYFFIIDEINRGNLSKIFGELLMLIENDKRNEKLLLTYSKDYFSVPENLYIVGMMNMADRSLAIMDYALRRRFSFFQVNPAFDNSTFKGYQSSFNNEYFNECIDKIKRLNKEIEKDVSLGTGFKIGHSYFCKLKNGNKEEIKSIIKYEIIPMIEEYWFDDSEKVENWKKILLGE